ncbi:MULTISPECIES: alpha/beta fold hydrolase [Sphingobacterium]|uniref:alpha/beta fold hydrolase n=1 Tax=Sphingobacterium TaxID=28453 RepID=UPI0008A61D67|nr:MULTISPECIES: alpha/beta hydrolase [Sphingobacterium]OFV11092.1 alpha/beta hydrolase [Sphingobacterium sp. HMSC13C05]HAF32783.1 alpha/beta hydrolase [Sphingobacterium sp.]
MNTRIKTNTIFKSLLYIIMMITIMQSYAQIKPSAQGLVHLKDSKVYYEIYGTGKPIVLLHGAFMTISTNWSQLIPELSKNRKVIAIELQGHGHSPYSDRKFDHAILAADVAKVMDYLKIEHAAVLGYSFGGAVAYQFAIQYPKRLDELVIISATYKSKGWMPEINKAFQNMKPALFENSPMQQAYETVAPDKTKWTKFLEQMISLAQQPYDLGDANIAKISSPVLLIAGDNDGLDKIELVKTYQLLGGEVVGDFGQMPKSQLAIIPGQSHVSLIGQTGSILGYLNSFLK